MNGCNFGSSKLSGYTRNNNIFCCVLEVFPRTSYCRCCSAASGGSSRSSVSASNSVYKPGDSVYNSSDSASDSVYNSSGSASDRVYNSSGSASDLISNFSGSVCNTCNSVINGIGNRVSEFSIYRIGNLSNSSAHSSISAPCNKSVSDVLPIDNSCSCAFHTSDYPCLYDVSNRGGSSFVKARTRYRIRDCSASCVARHCAYFTAQIRYRSRLKGVTYVSALSQSRRAVNKWYSPQVCSTRNNSGRYSGDSSERVINNRLNYVTNTIDNGCDYLIYNPFNSITDRTDYVFNNIDCAAYNIANKRHTKLLRSTVISLKLCTP